MVKSIKNKIEDRSDGEYELIKESDRNNLSNAIEAFIIILKRGHREKILNLSNYAKNEFIKGISILFRERYIHPNIRELIKNPEFSESVRKIIAETKDYAILAKIISSSICKKCNKSNKKLLKTINLKTEELKTLDEENLIALGRYGNDEQSLKILKIFIENKKTNYLWDICNSHDNKIIKKIAKNAAQNIDENKDILNNIDRKLKSLEKSKSTQLTYFKTFPIIKNKIIKTLNRTKRNFKFKN